MQILRDEGKKKPGTSTRICERVSILDQNKALNQFNFHSSSIIKSGWQ